MEGEEVYADDLVLIARNGIQIERMLGDLEGVFAQLGLEICMDKLELLNGPMSEEMRPTCKISWARTLARPDRFIFSGASDQRRKPPR